MDELLLSVIINLGILALLCGMDYVIYKCGYNKGYNAALMDIPAKGKDNVR